MGELAWVRVSCGCDRLICAKETGHARPCTSAPLGADLINTGQSLHFSLSFSPSGGSGLQRGVGRSMLDSVTSASWLCPKVKCSRALILHLCTFPWKHSVLRRGTELFPAGGRDARDMGWFFLHWALQWKLPQEPGTQMPTWQGDNRDLHAFSVWGRQWVFRLCEPHVVSYCSSSSSF